jgi:hypothetical protein
MKRGVIFILVLSAALCAQAPTSTPAKEVVFFSFHNAKLEPPDYTFQLSRDCTATYTAKPGEQESKTNEDADSEPDREAQEAREQGERREVRISDGTCNSIFDTAKGLGYFKGDFEFRKHKVAYSGDRTLGYFAPGVSNKTQFTWSENPRIQQLSVIFEGISATLEAEPKLKHLRRYDRLGLNEALKGLEGQAAKGWLRELQLIAPELQSIANDGQIMNIARERARHLLAMAESPAPLPASAKK